MSEKQKLLVSFSGGETSAFMAQWLKRHKSNEYDMIFVFANTGQENEETLEFVDWCDRHFELGVIWVEAVVHHNEKKGSTHKLVTFESASRKGEPFEEVIKKYGIPNQAFPHCNRELKLNPIHSYVKSLGWTDYYTAIGIRIDEMDRVSSTHKEKMILYPLISFIKMTKPMINLFWSQQDFRLQLKGYQGNCKACWKKSEKKLLKIANENPLAFEFVRNMESKYGSFIPNSRKKDKSKTTSFFRKNKTAEQILVESKNFNQIVIDDSDNYPDESCDLFSQCGIDN